MRPTPYVSHMTQQWTYSWSQAPVKQKSLIHASVHQYVCLPEIGPKWSIFCFGNWIFVNRASIVLCVLSILPFTIYVFFHFRVRAIWVHLFSKILCLLSCGTLSVVNSPCGLLTWAEISVWDCHQVNCGSAWKKSTNSPLREITAFTSLSRILTTKPIVRFILILR